MSDEPLPTGFAAWVQSDLERTRAAAAADPENRLVMQHLAALWPNMLAEGARLEPGFRPDGTLAEIPIVGPQLTRGEAGPDPTFDELVPEHESLFPPSALGEAPAFDDLKRFANIRVLAMSALVVDRKHGDPLTELRGSLTPEKAWAQGERDYDALRDREQPSRTEPRALLVKCQQDTDFYVAWSDVTESPCWYGTRDEAAAYGYAEERIARADEYGTSSQPMVDTACTIPWSGGCFYGWDSRGMVAEQRGFLPRRFLRAYALLYDAGELQAAFDLLEPFDGMEP